VDIFEVPTGVTVNYIKVNGGAAIQNIGRNYVYGHQDFELNVSFSGTPLKVYATGLYSNKTYEFDNIDNTRSDLTSQPLNGSKSYFILQVIEPWSITFGPETTSGPPSLNESVGAQSPNVYVSDNTLYITSPAKEKISVYSITGALLNSVEKPTGEIRIPAEKIGKQVLIIRGSSGWTKKTVKL
jgi:hypothetical protein